MLCDQEEHESKGIPSADEEPEEESALRDILVELGRTVVVLTMGQSSVRTEDLQDYLSSMFSIVLNNPVIPDLLFKLGPQSGLELSLDIWRDATTACAEQWMNDVLDAAQDVHGPGQSDSSDDPSEMMQQMMPVVSQILAGLPPFESTLQPQQNDDAKFVGEIDSSLQLENGGADQIVASNEEAVPARLP